MSGKIGPFLKQTCSVRLVTDPVSLGQFSPVWFPAEHEVVFACTFGAFATRSATKVALYPYISATFEFTTCGQPFSRNFGACAGRINFLKHCGLPSGALFGLGMHDSLSSPQCYG
jgi:hypothetical protein